MVLLHITLLYLVVYKGICGQTDVCSPHGLFSGIARDRKTLSKRKSLIVYDIDPSTCDDGIRCKNICLSNTFVGNYFEVRVVSHWFALFSNYGYGNDCHV